MNVATFRTECYDDWYRAVKLMEELVLTVDSVKRLIDPVNPNYSMMQFTIVFPEAHTGDELLIDVERVRRSMTRLIEGEDRYTDLHRCHQTLQLGNEPNEEWYKDHDFELRNVDTIAAMREHLDKSRNK